MPITINGQELPEEAIEHEYRRLLQFYSQHMPAEALKKELDNLRAKAVEQAIGAKLLIDEAAQLDLKVPPELVDEHMEKMAEQVGGKEVLKQRLAEQNMTEEDLWKHIEGG